MYNINSHYGEFSNKDFAAYRGSSVCLSKNIKEIAITSKSIEIESGIRDIAQCSSIDLTKDDKRMSITLTCSMQLENASPDKIFYFFEHLDRYYLDISNGHRKFKVLNGNTLKQNALIEVEETAGGQYVKHKYQVVEVVENKFIQLISDTSTVQIWGGLLTVPVKTIVEFEIGHHTISSKLTLKFDSSFMHFIADRMGTREIWEAHIKEEMDGAARLIRSDGFINDYKSR